MGHHSSFLSGVELRTWVFSVTMLNFQLQVLMIVIYLVTVYLTVKWRH